MDNKQVPTQEEVFNNISYYSRYPAIRTYYGKAVWQLREKVSAYVQQNFASKQERQLAHENFIWNLKNFYSTPFKKEAIGLIDENINQLDISDKEKVAYLNYVLSMRDFSPFSLTFFEKFTELSDLSSVSGELKNKVFYKMKTLMDKKKKNKEAYVDLQKKFYPYLVRYAQNLKNVSYRQIEEFSDLLFDISERVFDRRVSLDVLLHLAQHTKKMQLYHSPKLFDDMQEAKKKKIDKDAIKMVAKKYHNFVHTQAENGKSRDMLYQSMMIMLMQAVSNFEYTETEVKQLRNCLTENVDGKPVHDKMKDLSLQVQRSYRNSLPRVFNQRNKTIVPFLKDAKTHWD